MCNFDDGFKLCTCDTDNETDVQPNTYIWSLLTLDKCEPERGICNFPVQDIGEGLEHEWVELNLNCENCFDFDYQPAEGDNLVIHKPGQYRQGDYLSFMYEDNTWKADSYNEAGYISKLKHQGKVKSR